MRHFIRRALHGTVFGTLVAGLLIAAVLGFGQPSTLGETGAQHGTTDLAGSAMSQIETQSRVHAARVAAETGVCPGVGGTCGSVLNTPEVPNLLRGAAPREGADVGQGR